MQAPKSSANPNSPKHYELLEALVRSSNNVQKSIHKVMSAGKPAENPLPVLHAHESLRADFPKLAAVLGDEVFLALSNEYIQKNPLENLSSTHVGHALPCFLNYHALSLRHPFLFELARFEHDCFTSADAAETELLSSSYLQNLPAETLGQVHFQLTPSCSVKSFRWQVDSLWERAGSFCSTELNGLLKKTDVLIWKKDGAVHFRRIDSFEEQVMPQVEAGVDFATLGERANEILKTEDALITLGNYIQKWMSEDLLSLPMPSNVAAE